MNSNGRIFFLLVFFFITLNSIPVSSKDSASESKSYILACGASGEGTDTDGRKWEPDTKYVNSSGNTITASAETQDPSLPSTIPYMTARIFTSAFTYKFSVPKKSRLWVRLHFYPSTYSSLQANASYFAVTANKLQLLKNFSASITAQALTMVYIIKEFSLTPIESGNLDLTFTPSSDYEDSYGFVNGIEVIPMPDIYQSAVVVGLSQDNLDLTNSSLQTMYRLNVGGQYIPASNDSGPIVLAVL